MLNALDVYSNTKIDFCKKGLNSFAPVHWALVLSTWIPAQLPVTRDYEAQVAMQHQSTPTTLHTALTDGLNLNTHYKIN